MKTATALTLVAIGAILAFAVTAQPHFFSFHMAGWVLIVVGCSGPCCRAEAAVRCAVTWSCLAWGGPASSTAGSGPSPGCWSPPG